MSNRSANILLEAALGLNYSERRSRTAESILKIYQRNVPGTMTLVEAFDFSMGAYLGLLVAEALIRGTDCGYLRALVAEVVKETKRDQKETE